MDALSRRSTLKLVVLGPSLVGGSVASTSGCDASIIIAIVNLIAAVVPAIVNAAQNSGKEGSHSGSSSGTNGSGDFDIVDFAGGEVVVENTTDRTQTLEMLIELFSTTSGLQNDTYFRTVDGKYPKIPAQSKVKLILPNLGSDVAGEHFLRVTVGGERMDSSNTIMLNA